MSIEPNTLRMISDIYPQHLMDLVLTVCEACIRNRHIKVDKESKVAIAKEMIIGGITMLEDCDVNIDLTLDCNKWVLPVKYKTKHKI